MGKKALTENEVRRQVNQYLAPDRVSERAWRKVVEWEWMQPCQIGEMRIADLAARIPELVGWREREGSCESREESSALPVSEEEKERLDALATYLGMVGARRQDVRAYRQRYLPDGLRPAGEGLLHWELLQRGAVLPPEQAEELRLLIAMLTTSYPWTEAEAAAFVIEGTIPGPPQGRARLICFEGDDYRRARLELEFDIRMDADQLAGFVRSVQRSWLSKKNCPLTPRGLALFRFAASQWREDDRLRLSEIGRRWNRAHPDEPAMTEQYFDKAFHRVEQHLANRRPAPG